MEQVKGKKNYLYIFEKELSLKDNFRDIIEIDVCINYYS